MAIHRVLLIWFLVSLGLVAYVNAANLTEFNGGFQIRSIDSQSLSNASEVLATTSDPNRVSLVRLEHRLLLVVLGLAV